MENQDYDSDKVPKKILSFERGKRADEIARILDTEERKHMDDDEMRQIEPGQNVGFYNFFK